MTLPFLIVVAVFALSVYFAELHNRNDKRLMKKDFVEQLNDLIAPITRAWKEVEIVTVTVDHEGFAASTDDELVVDVRLVLSKTIKS